MSRAHPPNGRVRPRSIALAASALLALVARPGAACAEGAIVIETPAEREFSRPLLERVEELLGPSVEARARVVLTKRHGSDRARTQRTASTAPGTASSPT